MHIPRACARGGSTALGLAMLLVLITLVVASGAWANTGSATLNFNATSIPADGRYIWVNSVINPTLAGGADPVTVYMRSINFHIVKGAAILDVPGLDSSIVCSSSSVAGPATFSGGRFAVPDFVPTLSGDEFADGLASPPAVGLRGADATWPMEATTWRPVGNGDHVGVPGGTRGGGSNWTGSYSSTMAVPANFVRPVPEPGTLPILASGLSLCALFLRRRMRRS